MDMARTGVYGRCYERRREEDLTDFGPNQSVVIMHGIEGAGQP